MPKINIQQIATWRSGEVITEQKLNEVFSLIGKVINEHYEEYELLIKKLNELHLASRWVGQVDNFVDIPVFIEANKNNPNFQPPNDPLPTSGDVIFVNNNSDDHDLPPGINPGRYLYIYHTDADGSNGKWELFNPWTLVNAGFNNDGLMSKEDWKKLNELPDKEQLELEFANDRAEISILRENFRNLKPIVEQNKNDIANLKPRVDNIEQNKQDKATNLRNYKTKNVEDNLVEVKDLVDELTEQEIMIWEAGETPTETTLNGTLGEIELEITDLDQTKLESDTHIKIYLTLKNDSGLTDITIADTVQVLTTSYRTTKTSGAFNINGVIIHYTINLDENKIVHLVFDKDYEFTDTYTLTALKIIKDIGVSDYMWAEKIEEDIKDFLGNNIGVKTHLIYVNNRLDGFNGFRQNDEYTLPFNYLLGANAVALYLGGTRLTKGIEWEEVAPTALDIYGSKIKFLMDIDIRKEGAIEVVITSVLYKTFVVGIWDKHTTWVKGSLVIHNGKMWYAIKDNVGVKPGTETPGAEEYWKQFDSNIDIEAIKAELEAYIDRVAADRVDEIIDTKVEAEVDKQLDALPTVEYKPEGVNRIVEFKDEVDYEAYKTFYNIDDSYFQNVDEDNFFTDGYMMQITDKYGTWVAIDNPIGDIVKYKNNIENKEINLNYNITSTESWTGNYFNGKKIYVIDLPLQSAPIGNITLLSNVEMLIKEYTLVNIQADQWTLSPVCDFINNSLKIGRVEFNYQTKNVVFTNTINKTFKIKPRIYYTKVGE